MPPRLLIVALILAATALPAPPDPLLENGKRTYQLLCQSCHGEDGDSLNYADIIPLAGIGRRYPPQVIGELAGVFTGRYLHGKDREGMVRYLSSLRGAKGYADPGWLMIPAMLARKAPRVHEFRVLDARPRAAYDAGHVPNAISVDPGACTAPPPAGLNIGPTTAVVIYDETGGPAAACLWLRFRRAGHPFVAVLDGGWRRWVREGRLIIPAGPRPEPGPPEESEWTDANGFLPQSELERKAMAGSQVNWNEPRAAILALVLALTGGPLPNEPNRPEGYPQSSLTGP